MSEALERHLEREIEGEVRFDRVSRALYSTDASVYQIEPLGVVVPKSRADVVATVSAARQYGTSITARGGGTSQAGQAVGAGLQLDTAKYFNRILDLNVAERWVRVEPGIVLDELNTALKPHGLRFAPDISTASRATIGGMVANNSSGARSVVYGKTIDHVRTLDVVLDDGSLAHFGPLDSVVAARLGRGSTREAVAYRAVREQAERCRDEIARRFPKVLRRVGGYNLDEFVDPTKPFNLSKIIVGSEGTLALVVAATLNLVPLPAAKAVLAIEFDELLDALAATPAILRHTPSAVEVMDRFILDHAREQPALEALRHQIMQGDAGALLCVEFYGESPDDLKPRLAALEQELAASALRCRWRRFEAAADQARVWSFREAALGLSMAMKGDAKSLSFVEDTAVAPEKLRDYIDRFLTIIRAHGTSAGVYAHASVGCLHVRPVVNLKTSEGVNTFESIANAIADLVLEFGGALSGEHGDGLVRGPFIEKMFGPVLYDAFREVKHAFDPQGVFNPGKIVDTPPLTANLRYGAGYRTPDPVSYFDYTDHGGLGRAVEMCSGLGVCRKKTDGTMCPSYMATLEEKHSTRGRANTLRLAMAGRLAAERLDDHDVYEVLDLCLECRACKAECPVGVDVGRFKSEFLAQYWKERGTPLGVKMIGNISTLLSLGSRMPSLTNLIGQNRLARWLAESLFGIDRRRALPRLAPRTFLASFERAGTTATRTQHPAPAPAPDTRHQHPAPSTQHPAPVLFTDTFTNFCRPDIGLDAAAVLRACNLLPQIVPHTCCGRPLISKGLLDEARALASRNAEALYDVASAGHPLVFLEPSCLSAVREDAPALLRGDAQRKARVVSDACVLFEEFLEECLRSNRSAMRLRGGPPSILLHGHCHQKAMGLLPSSRALLTRIPGSTVVDLDAGCCGMAGSFGYTRDHYDVSQAIGERRLLPAARSLSAGSVLVASGTSCREQVAHFTGVTAQHPAELLRSLLTDESR
jgi:FAD/FMN-containing dehydrogenase/Fe-S oxidoreductase